MRHGDYPFDSNGNYVTSWAAEGGASPGPSDYRPAKHHDDSPPPRRTVSSASTVKPKSKSKVEDSPPKKVASSTPKKDSPTPSKSSSPPSKKPVGKSSGGGGSAKHVVKSSDTLFGLAKKYGTTVAKIKAANGLTSDSLRDGRTLTIPK